MPPGKPGPVARFAWIVGLVSFSVCVLIGFGVGFVAGQSEPTKRSEKPVPEVAKLTKNPSTATSNVRAEAISLSPLFQAAKLGAVLYARSLWPSVAAPKDRYAVRSFELQAAIRD